MGEETENLKAKIAKGKKKVEFLKGVCKEYSKFKEKASVNKDEEKMEELMEELEG